MPANSIHNPQLSQEDYSYGYDYAAGAAPGEREDEATTGVLAQGEEAHVNRCTVLQWSLVSSRRGSSGLETQ